ncbi:MAG: hypothetical protein QOI88_876 [Gammaproteobacteria bacterium]|jgi:tetratricopeptide (TPR) repeat protein|nr:hypothetical protein [Gammaproteobacteria bacterium]
MTDEISKRAEELHEAGMKHSASGDEGSAIMAYLRALALDPRRPETLYNLGLIYKYRRDWWESYEYNRRARALRPDDEATLWNLAIAATALQDWQTARDVWQTLKIIAEPGEGPIDEDLGSTPVRLNADESTDAPTEVVWARRLCLVRARILSIPTGATGFRHGDVVLHDGAAVGYRLNSGGHEVPVFNVLQLFEPSRLSTFEASVEVDEPADIEALNQACDQAGIAFEDWTASLRNLCKACSEGGPYEGHDHELRESDSWERTREVGFSTTNADRLTTVLDGWKGRRRRVVDLRCTLDARLS